MLLIADKICYNDHWSLLIISITFRVHPAWKMYELQLNFYIFRFVFKSDLAMCRWNGHTLLHAEYRIAAEEVCVPPAFVAG